MAQRQDSIYLRCTYEFTSQLDSSDKNKIKKDQMLLNIGQKHSEFYSDNTYKIDSLLYNEQKKGSLSLNAISEIRNLGIKPGAFYYIEHNYEEKQRYYDEYISTAHFQYTESIPLLPWKIDADTSSLLGYPTQKAEVNYGGRQWIVWFTSSIPIGFGPWNLNGLPGLILQAYDSNHYFNFTAIGLEKVTPKTVFGIFKQQKSNSKAMKVSKTELLKADYKAHTNFFDFLRDNLGKHWSVAGEGDILKSYIPIKTF